MPTTNFEPEKQKLTYLAVKQIFPYNASQRSNECARIYELLHKVKYARWSLGQFYELRCSESYAIKRC